MGQEVSTSRFSDADYRKFSAKLHDNLNALSLIITTPGFGCGPASFGAELEFYLVDGQGQPLHRNIEVRDKSADAHVTLELNRYNLEYNFPVYSFAHQPFIQLETSIQTAQWRLNQAAAEYGGQVVAIGILPTLTEYDLGPSAMTHEPRYEALADILTTMRGGAFELAVERQDDLHIQRNDITAEGVCTSFQVHFGFPLEDFVDTWNALTLVTPLVLALSSNSPLLFGKRLWHETRVPLFQQATDGRRNNAPWHDIPRVDLPEDWLRHSPFELFARQIYLYPPLIPVCHEEDPLAVLNRGYLPALHELNLHNGTIWHWNRPIYSHVDGGHIRVEMRSLPAGPSAIDMTASAAFHIGLAVGLRGQMEALLPAMPSRFVRENFQRAARDGIEAKLIWPSLQQNRLWEKPVQALAASLINTARRGLITLGVAASEVDKMLAIIERRVETGQTGAVWQLNSFERLSRRYGREQALQQVLLNYQHNALSNRPVADWELAE